MIVVYIILLVFAALILLIGCIPYRFGWVYRRIHHKGVERFQTEIGPELAQQLFSDSALEEVDPHFRPLAQLLLEGNAGNKLSAGNSLEIITTGERKWEALLADIRQARKFIHLEYFRLGNDEAGRQIHAALLQKAREGVQVRYINETYANRRIPWSYYKAIREAGGEVRQFTNPKDGLLQFFLRLDSRNHRKIVVIDGRVGYTGGMNLNNNYRYKWRDTHLRIEGPAVHALEASFIDTWLTSGGRLPEPLPAYFNPSARGGNGPLQNQLVQVVTDEPDFPVRNVQVSYEWILAHAREYVYMQTPYFIPPRKVLNAMKAAAARGVDVRLMVPKDVDTPLIGPVNRTFFRECLKAGIKLYLREGNFIHAKTLVADDYLTLAGASNLDWRSFDINHEVNTYIYNRQTALSAREVFLADIPICQALDLSTWRSINNLPQLILGRLVRLFFWVL